MSDLSSPQGRAERRPRMDFRPSTIGHEPDDPISKSEENMPEGIVRPADANSELVGEDTPLHIAVRNQQDDVARKALQFEGADINARDARGKTALHIAIDDRNIRILETLLIFNPDLDLKSPNGMPPLHSAVIAQWKQGARLLLLYDLDINATDADGNTALHLACSAGQEDLAYELLRSGANMDICDSGGRSPFQLAVESGSRRLPELLLQHGAKPDYDRCRAGSMIDEKNQDAPDRYRLAKEQSGTRQNSNDETRTSDLDPDFAKFSAEHWDGVRRNNGDGCVLTNYDNHDIFFDGKVEYIRLLMHEGHEMHAIQLKLNFMKPFSTRNRIRYAKVDAKLAICDPTNMPHIHSIMPQADRVEVSEQEISSGQTLTVGASGGGGPSNVNISMEGSKSRKSTFKGVRIIHGVVKDRMHASWRMYEEPGSQSGLPEIVRLLLLVQCKAEFDLTLAMSVKACHASSFGLPRTLNAKKGSPYRVPDITTMLKLDRAMKLKNILNVADRAATSVEEATILEKEFARAIRNHGKRALIMKASSRDDYLQEWGHITDATREGNFSILHDKLLQLEVNEHRERPAEQIIIEPEGRSSRIIREAPMRRYRSPSLRRRRSSDFGYEAQYERDGREMGRRLALDVLSREQPNKSQARNAMESFSAVGPGYKVSRLA